MRFNIAKGITHKLSEFGYFMWSASLKVQLKDVSVNQRDDVRQRGEQKNSCNQFKVHKLKAKVR